VAFANSSSVFVKGRGYISARVASGGSLMSVASPVVQVLWLLVGDGTGVINCPSRDRYAQYVVGHVSVTPEYSHVGVFVSGITGSVTFKDRVSVTAVTVVILFLYVIVKS